MLGEWSKNRSSDPVRVARLNSLELPRFVIPEGSPGYLVGWGPLGLRCIQHDSPLFLFGFQRPVTAMGTSKDTMWVSSGGLFPGPPPSPGSGSGPRTWGPSPRQRLLSLGGGGKGASSPCSQSVSRRLLPTRAQAPPSCRAGERHSAVLTLTLSSSS